MLTLFVVGIVLVALVALAVVVWLSVRLWKMGRAGRCGAIALPCFIVLLITVALYREQAQNARVEAQNGTLESALRNALKAGDSSDTIERVLRENRLRFTYSDVLRGYYATVATEKSDSTIHVIVSVDEAKRVRAISVKLHYTFL